MKLLFLAKRRPQGRDLIEHPHGRFHHLPTLLAARGHKIHTALLDYRRGAPTVDVERDGVTVTSHGLTRYLGHTAGLAHHWHPDWIIGLSDTWFGILAQRLARRYDSHCAIDAYDNYEGYIPWAKPLHWVWRRALTHADLTIAAGPALAAVMNVERPKKAGIVVPMAVDADKRLAPLDRDRCRDQLDLPQGERLIGYCGSLHPNRGLETLFKALEQLNDVRLVTSGRISHGITLPQGTIHLGFLPDEYLPRLFNALDLLAVINRDSAFGNFSYPIKLYEAMACHLPAVVTATPATRWILADRPELLVPPGDAAALAERITATLSRKRIDYGPQPSWAEGATIFESALKRTLRIVDH